MTNQLEKQKLALRAQMLTSLAQVGESVLHDASWQAADRLAATEAFRQAEAIMIFLPLRLEIDARPLALRAWQMGKTVTVPLVGYAQKHMIPLTVRSLDEPMEADKFGVRTPREGQPFPIEMLDMVVVPGLAFDRRGYRLGRGGGFYDRFLAHPRFRGCACGLALERQVVDRVPIAEHDRPLDMLTTDRQLLQFHHAAVK